MKNILLLLPAITWLVACPTPSENVPNNGQGGGQPSTNGQPMGPPPGDGSSPPPQGGEGGTPPQGGDGEGSPQTPEQGADQNAPVQQPPQVPESDKPPEGGIITDSLLIRVNRIPAEPIEPKYSQESLADEKHVTFSGTAICSECSDGLILRVVRFIGPNANPTENDLITQKNITEGDFSILVPQGEEGIALELLVDTDKSGAPSVGERFAVIEMGGQLIPSSDKNDLTLNATDRETFKPAPVPNGAPEQ